MGHNRELTHLDEDSMRPKAEQKKRGKCSLTEGICEKQDAIQESERVSTTSVIHISQVDRGVADQAISAHMITQNKYGKRAHSNAIQDEELVLEGEVAIEIRC